MLVAAVAEGVDAERRLDVVAGDGDVLARLARTAAGQGDGHLQGGEGLAPVAAGPQSTRWSTASSSAVAPSARSPRRTSSRRASVPRGSSRNSVDRLSSGGLTSKYGFSVVAPISTIRPSSTAGSRASCWDLLKRWTSSRNRIVPWPCSPRRWRRAGDDLADVLDARRRRPTAARTPSRWSRAISRASVVLPVPGGPQRITERAGRPRSARRRGASGPEQVLLAHHLVERGGAQPVGQRRPGRQPLRRSRREEIVRHRWRLRLRPAGGAPAARGPPAGGRRPASGRRSSGRRPTASWGRR